MRNKKRRTSSSRDRSFRDKKNEIDIKQKSSSLRKRAIKRKKHKQRVYMRRRILLSLGLIFLLYFSGSFIYKKLTAYNKYTYPAFRDEIRNSIGQEVFVGSTSQRSLTSAEKLSDLDTVYENISRNYAVRMSNKKDFQNFTKAYEATKKKVLGSKTDQEYFEIIKNYIDLLNNPRTKLIDKKSYDDLLKYYKNNIGTKKSEIIQNPQAVDRYKRMIGEKEIFDRDLFSQRNHVLVISMQDFYLGDVNKHMKIYKDILNNNQALTKVLIDLSNNQSLDDIYWQKFLKILSHKDYSHTSLVFYRGNLIKNTLEDMKKEQKVYKTSFIQNQSIKYPNKVDEINLDDYMYYDEVSMKIEHKKESKNMGVYVITNDFTSNEAIRFATALKISAEALLIKNSSQTENSLNDSIRSFPADYFILKHSGLLVSIDNSFSIEKENPVINYDQFINTDNPIEAVLSNI